MLVVRQMDVLLNRRKVREREEKEKTPNRAKVRVKAKTPLRVKERIKEKVKARVKARAKARVRMPMPRLQGMLLFMQLILPVHVPLVSNQKMPHFQETG